MTDRVTVRQNFLDAIFRCPSWEVVYKGRRVAQFLIWRDALAYAHTIAGRIARHTKGDA